MAKVTIVQVIYNSKRFIKPVFSAIFNQTFKDFEVAAVISGNEDGGKEFLAQEFPKVKIFDPGFNIGFAKGHNLAFENFKSEFYQLVNPDLIMEPNYIEEMLKAFGDEKVGAATGKLYKILDFGLKIVDLKKQKQIIDTTGVVISKSGRARDRGQHEVDNGQYDNNKIVQAVSAAGAMYSAKALEAVKSGSEYFDESFHSYWEDVDLAWRMTNKGYKCIFVPSAVGFHGRNVSSSVGGYKKFWSFVRHHHTLPKRVRQLNYKNHILMYIKNSPKFYLQFFVREFFMFFYILFFEIGTLKILPELFKSIPVAFRKRIKKTAL
jgi:GT2 family glycosyltransferase